MYSIPARRMQLLRGVQGGSKIDHKINRIGPFIVLCITLNILHRRKELIILCKITTTGS